ncbi:MAG: hypothetical protein LEGION0403_FIIPPAGN_01333 [Legionella sp.]
MGHRLKILYRYANNQTWFLHSKYPISYKLVLVYCFYQAIKSSEIELQGFKDILSNTYKYIKSLPKNSFNCDYYSIYRFFDHDAIAGVFCVDHTHTCYPLVFYHNDYKPNESRKLRVIALQKCVFDILKKSDSIFQLIKSSNEWNESLQNSILQIIPES